MHATKAPLAFDGASVSATVGAARIRVERLRAGVFYVEVCHIGPAGIGPVVDELTRSWPTEAEARTAARGLFRAFYAGLSVAAVIAELTATVDAALDRAWRGGDGTGRAQAAIPVLDALREQLRTPADRAEREARLAEMAETLAATAPVDPDADRWAAFDRYLADAANDPANRQAAQESPRPRNFRELRDAHRRGMRRGQRAA